MLDPTVSANPGTSRVLDSGGRSRAPSLAPVRGLRLLGNVRLGITFALALTAVTALRAQTTIVLDGSFEEGIRANWNFTGALGVNYPNDADGHVSLMLLDSPVWQDLPTVPGRDYAISLAVIGGLGRDVWGSACDAHQPGL